MLNRIILMGRLTADPELRQVQSGSSTCQFTVACDRNFVQQGQERQADFITVVAWNKTAEFVSKYFSKGCLIAVEGNLKTRTYDDKRYPEVKHYVTEVYADQVYFGGDKPQESQSQFSQPTQTQTNSTVTVEDFGDFEEVIGNSDLPF